MVMVASIHSTRKDCEDFLRANNFKFYAGDNTYRHGGIVVTLYDESNSIRPKWMISDSLIGTGTYSSFGLSELKYDVEVALGRRGLKTSLANFVKGEKL